MAKPLAPNSKRAPAIPRLAARDCRCVVLDTEAEFRACADEWRALRTKCQLDDPFSEWEYVWSWWRTFGRPCPRTGRNNPIFILKVYSPSNELVALLPFVTSPLNRRLASPRVMRLFGHNGTLGPADMSEMPLHLVLPGWEPETTRALSDAVRSRLEKRACDAVLVRLSYAHCDELFTHETATLSPLASVVLKPRTGAMIASLPDDYKAYIKGLSKSMRDNTKYYPKLLARAGHGWSVRTVSQPNEFPEALDLVIDLHRLRAKTSVGLRHEDHLPTAVQADFLHDLMLRKAEEGKAFVSILEIDGQTVAAQAFFAHGDKISVYYSGFDPSWAKFSPITVLQAKVFEESIGRGFRKIDFFLEDAPWKARWGAVQVGPCVEVFLCSRSAVSVARTMLWAAARAVRRAWESLEKNRRTLIGHVRRLLSKRPAKA